MNDASDPKISMICRLPLEFQERGNVSIMELLSRTGYRHGDALKAEQLIPTLRNHPAWIDAWFAWSDDKRTTGGWFVHEFDDHFVVRSYPPTTERPTQHFNEKAQAAAEFIVRELDDISTPLLISMREWLLSKLRSR